MEEDHRLIFTSAAFTCLHQARRPSDGRPLIALAAQSVSFRRKSFGAGSIPSEKIAAPTGWIADLVELPMRAFGLSARRGLRMMESAGNLLLAEVGAVVALDEKGDAPAGIHMARPRKGVVERVELLVESRTPCREKSILVERGDRLGPAGAAVCSIGIGVRSVPSSKNKLKNKTRLDA